MTAHKNTTCRYCQSDRLFKFLSLGDQPPSNSFLPAAKIAEEEKFPLDVYLCENCFLVQLLDVVSAEKIFHEYVYLASSSKALKNHYAQLATQITERFELKKGDVVVDIGCNDGILLSGYSSSELVKVGVEPSKVADIAAKAGFRVFKGFFSPEIAKSIVRDCGKVKIATATNVFPHVDNISRFTDGIAPLLSDDGVFIIEASYLIDVIDQTLFDTIYHEHLCYLSLTPVVRFLASHGLEVFDVVRVPFGASGPALRVFAQKIKGPRAVLSSVREMLEMEAKWGVGNVERYTGYADQVNKIKSEVLKLMRELQETGSRIGGYGAPAKGNTLLNYFNIKPDLVNKIAETNELKQGLLTPGSHIPIVSEERFLEEMPEYALLLTWNYLEFFLKNSEYIRRGGKFIVPIPFPRIVP
ncbi:MAG TPA: class I SAM-dependent methyltransferase [Chlamydiales bacterium]|nr:class I SAM-dependent methyltransferase [Chlamydiales bacterium]